MTELSELLKSYIKPELWVLIPVLYFIGRFIKKTPLENWKIPFILGVIGILLSALYVGSTCEVGTWQESLAAIFTAITQGVLVSGGAVYLANIIKQGREAKRKPPSEEKQA